MAGHLDVREHTVVYVEVHDDFVTAEGIEALNAMGGW
jgi:hypothetical protein